MNVLVVSEPFWPEGGGGSLATYLVVELLAEERDFKVTVVTGTEKPVRVNNIRFIVDPVLRSSSKVELLLRFTSPVVRRRYEKLLKDYDVLYFPSYASSGYALIPIAKKLGRKVVVHLHDYQPFAYNSIVLSGQRNGILAGMSFEARFEVYEHSSIRRAVLGSMLSPLAGIYRLWMRQADEIICVSRRQAEIVAEMAPELKGRIKVIYNPPPQVPLVEKHLGEPVLLYLGGGSYVKGFHVLLGAGWRILKRHRDARILLAGGFGDSARRLLEKLNKLSGGGYMLLGYLEHEKVLKLHSISYALLFPSIVEETMGYVVLESMLAGTMPVASRVGGVPEIVEGTPAEKLMFTPGDVDEFVDRIELVLSMSREQLADIGHRLRETALGKFNSERIKRELLRVFTV